MQYKGFVIPSILIAVALFLGVTNLWGDALVYPKFLTASPSSIWDWLNGKSTSKKEIQPAKKQKEKSQTINSQNQLDDILRQLTIAQKTGGISPAMYQQLDTALFALEKKGLNTKTARAILIKLQVGGSPANFQKNMKGRERVTAQMQNGNEQTLADVERELSRMLSFPGVSPEIYGEFDAKLKVFEAKNLNTKNARAMLKKLRIGGQEPPSQKKNENGPIVDKKQVASEPVVWIYQHDQNKWVPSRTPPNCPPLVFDSPVDLTKVSAILYPGQVRGNSIKDYKAHGGFLLMTRDAEVRMPFDGYVYQGARFLQNGTLQYAFDVISECGIMQRFGHLYELSPKLQKLVELLPEPKEMDSRTTVLRPFVQVKRGELIATKIGVPENPGTDWGVMDLRKENEAAKDPAFREAHAFQRWYDQHGLCWLEYLSTSNQALAKALPGGDGRMGKTSDYCGRSMQPPIAPVVETAHTTEPSDSTNTPPVKLKSIGIELGQYDPVTGRAGDFVFTKQKLQFERLFMGFGFFIPASSASLDKYNPQPTFILPLGTPVRSLVDGIVVAMPTLWSGDYSIQVTANGKMEKWIYETEHVINPKVKIGDKVAAGQIIGEVSNFDQGAPVGFGTVEIGILKGGNPPQHICPFAYLDSSIKEETLKKILAFYKSWEEYAGNSTLYNESESIPGCITLNPVNG